LKYEAQEERLQEIADLTDKTLEEVTAEADQMGTLQKLEKEPPIPDSTASPCQPILCRDVKDKFMCEAFPKRCKWFDEPSGEPPKHGAENFRDWIKSLKDGYENEKVKSWLSDVLDPTSTLRP
jgi:hypothetical protein